jgi:hypothetical protein
MKLDRIGLRLAAAMQFYLQQEKTGRVDWTAAAS